MLPVWAVLAFGAATCCAQWPFSSPAPAGTPFSGFTDLNGPGADSGGDQDVTLVEKPFNQLSDQRIGDFGAKALAIRPDEWKNAETDHFIIHYRRVTEAKRVAREVEFDINFVAAQLGAKPEQYQRKSHVFIFEDDNEWKTFLPQVNEPDWVASFARGDELFLSLRDTAPGGQPFDSQTLAHETTHAVVARLFPGVRWPLWLNEGFAEYMGAASVAARKNQTVRRHEHTLLFADMSLEQLQQIQQYPDDPVAVAQLYETAEKLIRFIMTELPRDRFNQFLSAVLGGQSLQNALMSVYPDKLASYDDFERKFARFTK